MKYMPIRNQRAPVGRNMTCPNCKSGLKFKKCCGKAVGPLPSKREVVTG